GLTSQALRGGDQAKALTYAERAFRLRPQTPWVVHSLFDMQAQLGQWKAAQDTLDAGVRRKVVTPDRGRTLKAVLLIERSRAARRPTRWRSRARPLRSRPSALPLPSDWPSCRSRQARADAP